MTCITVTLKNPSHEAQFHCPKHCTSAEPKDIAKEFTAQEKGKRMGGGKRRNACGLCSTPRIGLVEVLRSFFLPTL